MVSIKNISKGIFIWLLLCFLVTPLKVNAEDYEELDISSGQITIVKDGNYHITGSSDRNNIVISSGVNANIRLDNVSIKSGQPAIHIADNSVGNVTIELIGHNELISNGNPAVCKNGDADNVGKLTICGEGSLIAQNTAGDGAGIGSSNQVNTRNIYITGGTVTATAGDYGAGIGGGGGGGCASDIYISGGTVTATGGKNQGAGIGGGSDNNGSKGDAENIYITGGTVTAAAPGRGAGIGGGNGAGTDIYITGGTVSAQGAAGGNDIGGGKESQGPLVITVPVKGKNGSPATYNVKTNTLVYQDGICTASGNITLSSDIVINEGETLYISEGASLTNNAVITNNGTIINKGDITNSDEGILNLNEGSTYITNNSTTEIISGTAAVNTDGTINRGNAAIKETIKDDNGDVIETVITNEDGSYVKEGFSPAMTEGNGSKYDGKAVLLFCSDDELINFIQVNIDGKNLDAKYYELAGDGIKVTLKKEFLDTLPKGTHTLEIVSTNGIAKGTFTVLTDNLKKTENNNSEINSPATGDNNNWGLWDLLLFMSSIAVTGLYVYKRKSN